MEQYLKLKRTHQRFVDAYVEIGIASKAMMKVRPKAKRAKELAWRWMQIPGVKEAIEERKAQERQAFEDRRERHLEAMWNRANADRVALIDVSKNPPDPAEWPQELRDCIESLEFEGGVLTKVRTSNRNEASKLFSQHLRWLTERHEHTGANGQPLMPRQVVLVTQEEAERLDAELDSEV